MLSPSCSQAEQETEGNTEEGRSQRWTEARILLTFILLRINLPLDCSFTRIDKFPLPLSVSFCLSHFATNFLSHLDQKCSNRHLVWGLSLTFNKNSNLPFKEKPSPLLHESLPKAQLVRMGLSFIHNSIIWSLQGGLSMTMLTAWRTSAGSWSQLVSHLRFKTTCLIFQRPQVPRGKSCPMASTMIKCLRCPRHWREAVNAEDNREVTVFSKADMKADHCFSKSAARMDVSRCE